jgi:hypothetical protein
LRLLPFFRGGKLMSLSFAKRLSTSRQARSFSHPFGCFHLKRLHTSSEILVLPKEKNSSTHSRMVLRFEMLKRLPRRSRGYLIAFLLFANIFLTGELLTETLIAGPKNPRELRQSKGFV